MRATIAGVEAVDFQRRRTAHLEWWRGFWGRGAYPIKSNGSLFHQIHVIPFTLSFGNAQYLDKLTITSEQFYTLLKTRREHPQSSQAPVALIQNLFSPIDFL